MTNKLINKTEEEVCAALGFRRRRKNANWNEDDDIEDVDDQVVEIQMVVSSCRVRERHPNGLAALLIAPSILTARDSQTRRRIEPINLRRKPFSLRPFFAASRGLW